MIRLYLPVWAAVGVASLTMALIPRDAASQDSSWLSRRADQYDAELLRLDLTLLWGGESFGLSPLWSLRWEVLFSLMLPLFVTFAVTARKLWPVKLIIVVACLAVGAHYGWSEFRYLPMFALGALLAAHWDSITQQMGRILRSAPLGWTALALALCLVTTRWWAIALGTDPEHDRWMATVALAGGLLLVILAANWPTAQRFLEWRPMRWLGLISFSLYLVHESVIIAVRYLLVDQPVALVIALSIPASIFCAWVFHHGVESPANRLARRTGRKR